MADLVERRFQAFPDLLRRDLDDAESTVAAVVEYGSRARASEQALTESFLDRFGHDRDTYGLYRAAYAIITNAYFGVDGRDGHYLWCAQMLRRPDVSAALVG